MMRQEEQSAAVLRETESRAENYHQNEMSVAAQNFANLQAVTQQLRQELMSQTRELQENKLRFARHENQVAEERESIHREFRKNKEESLDFLRDLFARELDSRDQKADEKVARVREEYEDEVRGLKEQISILREKLEEERARSMRSHLSTPIGPTCTTSAPNHLRVSNQRLRLRCRPHLNTSGMITRRQSPHPSEVYSPT